jgi:hypothetical protein
MTRIINGPVTVKNAHLIYDAATETYTLQHYDTIILQVVNSEVLDIKPVSKSSIRAINQALRYLGFSFTAADIKRDWQKKGIYVPAIGAY